MVAALRALAALMWANEHEAITAGQEALALLPAGERLLRNVSTSVVGGGYWLVGEARQPGSSYCRRGRCMSGRAT